MSQPLLDPRNDLVFKLLFTRSLPLLSDLINAVRYQEAPIKVLKIRNPRIDPDELQGKFIILDILAEDEHGQLFDVEMQISQREKWSARSMYYLAKTLVGQLQTGDAYEQLKPVIGIHLLGYKLFPEFEQAIWHYEMCDPSVPGARLGSELQLYIVELPKADQQVAAGRHGAQALAALNAWVAYFQHGTEEIIMNQIAWPPVVEAWQHLKALSDDDETRRLADVRERALKTELTELAAAERRGEARGEARGKAQGEVEGEARGIAKTQQAALQALIADGMSEMRARTILGLLPD